MQLYELWQSRRLGWRRPAAIFAVVGLHAVLIALLSMGKHMPPPAAEPKPFQVRIYALPRAKPLPPERAPAARARREKEREPNTAITFPTPEELDRMLPSRRLPPTTLHGYLVCDAANYPNLTAAERAQCGRMFGAKPPVIPRDHETDFIDPVARAQWAEQLRLQHNTTVGAYTPCPSTNPRRNLGVGCINPAAKPNF